MALAHIERKKCQVLNGYSALELRNEAFIIRVINNFIEDNMQNSSCLKVPFKTPEQRDSFINKLAGLMRTLREQRHLERYFFNRYTNPGTGEFFVLMGFFNFDEDAEEVLQNLLNTTVHDQVVPYTCEASDIGGVNIEDLKCCSVEMYEAIQGYFGEKPSIEQMILILHFFMNQSNFGYEEESSIYLQATHRIVSTIVRH